MSGFDDSTENDNQRNRSRSPVRRQHDAAGDYSEQRDYREFRQRNDYRDNGTYERRNDGYGRNRGPRPNTTDGGFRGGRGRYGNRYDDEYQGGGRFDSAASERAPRSRYNHAKGDYGPVLARELDSTYEEKVNRNYSKSVFVGNLTYESTPEDLRDFFSQVGDVVRADIITSRGHHRGMGTVEFTNSEDVDEAIRQFDGSLFMERPIFVRQDNPPPDSGRSRAPPQREDRKQRALNDKPVYQVTVKNLPHSINWQALKDMFKECGRVLRADVEKNSERYSNGSGKVTFSNYEDMKRSLDKYNGFRIEGNVLEVSEVGKTSANSTPTAEKVEPVDKFPEGFVAGGERNNYIFCSNLPAPTTKGDLYDLFEIIGKVNRAELLYDADKNPTGVAIIEYQSIDDADVCIERLDKYTYGGCDLEISYAKKADS
ncbi:mRNA-binding protein KNAG_0H01710 [Huiozyma naganishii CBS 8797]|uniref:RRM domain-containing protein n=1 Tax=Huiozyma naganishii (strain ATCC MYA-139 / BCRC 22969 / CBS 8797 / KCTC 17520 / NBRC 10181 / NCYC 3082 / Yp74L-3) TaxID=1071383 RepID=J7S9M4_HUIN7|nr:hypothetical protein KNAG_0H01710 [Kazachstania naganishii CBS 8797]CCK71586.1 hypothetical protein KNAG_0H01710 [Kazachstania naganishii CBS 8797]